MAYFSIFQLLSVIVLSLFLVGLLNIFLTDKENACEMTFMYEYPQFVRINVAENEMYPQYGLYAYSEGRFTERARKMRFDGVPVLFLPGNIGSHKQVRSMASVALRKALPLSKYGFHFDYFTIDFNEEMSGLFGGVLEKQAAYSSHCLKAILQLYDMNKTYNTKPTSIIIIGHSMGGIVARYLITNPQNKDLVNVIITLASPHEIPIVSIDPYLSMFYNRINDYWKLKTINNSNLVTISDYWKNKVFISIGGGERDLLVPSALTTSAQSDISALTTSIPGVWLSTDHLCIVWCKQLVLVLNRFLFSIISQDTKQLTTNSSLIINMGNHFLRTGHTKNNFTYDSSVEFLPDANWYEDSRRQYNVKHDRVYKTWYYMVRLMDLPDHESVTFEAVNLEDKEWLFGCQAKYVHGQHRICMTGRHLSHFSKWTASKRDKRRMATLDLRALRASYPHWTHVLLRISPTNRPVEINVDIHSKGSRQVQTTMPALYYVTRSTIIKQTAPNALQYNISITGLDMLYQAYLLYVEPFESCTATQLFASAELIMPWAKGFEYYDFFTEAEKAPMKIRLLKGSPSFIKHSPHQVNLVLKLDPQCTYKISVAVSFYDILGQLARHYGTSLPAYFAAVLLLVLRHWASAMELNKDQSISFHAALCGENLKPYYLIICSRLGALVILSIPFLQSASSALMIAPTPSQNFLLLPIILYIIAIGIAHILGAICWGLLIFSGQVAHKVVLRLVSFGRSGGGNRFWEWVTKEIRNAPGFGSFLLIAIGFGSCGAASLVAGAAFYFFLLTKMYEDYLEDFVYKTIAKVAKKFRNMKLKTKDESISQKETVSQDSNINEKEEPAEASSSKKEKKILDESDISKTNNAVIQPQDETEMKPSSELNKRSATVNASSRVKRTSHTEKNDKVALDSLHFHFAMFFIWSFVTLLNVPTLLTWAHNFKYSKILDTDPSFYPSLIMSASAFSLWQIDAPKRNIKYYDILNKIIYTAAVVAIMIAPISIYRLNYLLAGIFLIITLHQTFSVDVDDDNAPNLLDDNQMASVSDETLGGDAQTDSEENTAETSRNVSREGSPFEKFQEMKEKFESE